MNIETPISGTQPKGVSIVQYRQDLQRFRDTDCAAAIWNRELPLDVSSWLAALDARLLPNDRVILPHEAVKDTVRDICDEAAMPDGEPRHWLIEDIARMADSFANLMKAPYLRLRLQAISTNACRKFHLDAITGRLVCTYRGQGTQYGTSARGKTPGHICTVPTGAPILLRGTLWPPEPATGLLHRSPPIEGTGETRLVLVLDPIFDPEDAE